MYTSMHVHTHTHTHTRTHIHVNEAPLGASAGGATSSASGGGGASSSSGCAAPGAAPKREIPQKVSPTVSQLRDELPSGAEVMVRILADGPTWTKARIWCVLSQIVWQAHSAEYSNFRSADERLKYYKGYAWGSSLSRLAKAALSLHLWISLGHAVSVVAFLVCYVS